MHRPFQRFNQILNFLIARPQTEVHRDRSDHEPLSGLRIAAGSQTPAQQIVHRTLERVAGASDLLLHKAGDIVVDGKSGAHIMMLEYEAS
jgi:hypothetical protein